ncbi:hypothetical protein AAMO2058_001751900 [Amorphochlora amoebiformis]
MFDASEYVKISAINYPLGDVGGGGDGMRMIFGRFFLSGGDKNWFCAIDGKQGGPFSISDVKGLIRDGKVRKETLVWREGMPNWRAVKDCSLNNVVFPPPPPVPKGRTTAQSVVMPSKPPPRRPISGSVSLKAKQLNAFSSSLRNVLERKMVEQRGITSPIGGGSMRSLFAASNRNPISTLASALTPKGKSSRALGGPGVPPPPKTNILSCLVDGKGLIEAIEKSSEFDLCMFKEHREKAVTALEKRVVSSLPVAQTMGLVLLSHSVRYPGVFGSIKERLTQPSSSIGDVLLYDFPLNVLMDKAKGHVVHPFQVNIVVKEVHVLDVFKTNSKPCLVNMLPAQREQLMSSPMRLIVKHGDDFRQDVATMLVFRLFNFLWRVGKLRHKDIPVRCHAYHTCATGENIGVIEFVENCFPLSKIKEIQPVSPEKLQRLVATGAGSYIAAFVLGIRDRHADNIMIRDDGVMFHIDFGRVFGDSVLMDTSSFAITKGFREQIGSATYGEFVQMCIKAFRVLREAKNIDLIMHFAPLMFSAMFPRDKIQDFLKKTLMLKPYRDLDAACKRLIKKIESAPDSYRTYFKNKMHSFAQASKGAL